MKSRAWKYGMLFLLSILALDAGNQATALRDCSAWNDLRHSRNAGNLHLKKGEKYSIVRKHKGQYLVRIPGTPVTQRWVQGDCITPSSTATKETSKPQIPPVTKKVETLLVLSWHNSFCEIHPNRKECRPLFNYGSNHLVLHGLWPQPVSRIYCGIPRDLIAKDRAHRWRALPVPRLPDSLRKTLLHTMPGTLSGLERHEWVKHGSCYDSDPVRYFSDAVTLTESVDRSMVGEYLRANLGRRIRLADLRKIFAKSFGKGMGSRLAMTCRRGLLQELRISLNGKGKELKNLLPSAKALKGGCREAIVDAPGLYRK